MPLVMAAVYLTPQKKKAPALRPGLFIGQLFLGAIILA
jgi:hypothetical protein